MTTILGIESTAHTFGVGIVRDGKVLANQREMYTTESGGIIPMESAKHHAKVKMQVYQSALDEAGIKEEDIDAIAFSQGPGLAPCLLEGMRFAKELARKFACNLHSPLACDIKEINNQKNISLTDFKRSALTKSGAEQGKSTQNIPLVSVNHCIAHLEIGKLTGAKDPVMLYVSGANTQIIAYSSGKYRIFGETLDIGVGNFIDNFARLIGIGFPGGPKIEKLAMEGKNYVELPYKVKGMDITLSGILTNLKQKIEGMSLVSPPTHPNLHSPKAREIDKTNNKENFTLTKIERSEYKSKEENYTMADLAFSMQETVFAMLVETAERALAHTGKTELLLGGGVACNSRLQEMCKIMCEERGAKFFCPEKPLLVDNGAMIAYLGGIMFDKGIKEKNLENIDIMPRQRTDEVDVEWK